MLFLNKKMRLKSVPLWSIFFHIVGVLLIILKDGFLIAAMLKHLTSPNAHTISLFLF